ncbi:MAG: hypothetical protein WC263_00940 [Candidatus Micrarchaeia archaeon]|jgi:hypothetical protein
MADLQAFARAQAPQAGAAGSGRLSQAKNRIVEFYGEYYLAGCMCGDRSKITGYNGSPASPIYKVMATGTLQELRAEMVFNGWHSQKKTVFVKREGQGRSIYAICEIAPAGAKRFIINAFNSRP